ncbi:MAG: phosphoesterase [Acidobacteria bacterium]|nr:phosphoesterase [Acidobacteriota bacterium]
MTERIYYLDAYCRTFDTRVARALQHEGRPAVVLDRTAFYPTSGGQPFDVGRLGGARVLDTVDLEDEIVHVISQPLEAGAEIDAEIDWNRRFDHMQQHTGQHVLSAAFDRLFDNRTVGFHMGADVSTIDLAREATPEDVERAVDEANRIVWEDRPVTIRFASQEEVSTLALRKESQREGTLRLVEVADFDLSACGGTHVTRTGAIGMIAVLSGERVRGGLRVTFACGGRALTTLRLYRDAVTGSVRSLSVLPAELPAAVERVQKEARDVRKQLKGVQDQLAVHEAERLGALAVPVGTASLLVEIVSGWEPAALKGLTSAVTTNRQVCAALLSPGPPVSIVLSCSAGVAVDVNACLQELLRQFGGKGGGKRDLAQGGGLTAPVETVAAAARAILESKLRSG